MLVEFRVSNFRSIRDEALLSLLASSDKTCEDTNVIQTDAPGVKRVLRSAAIFGPNASGKSTLLSALQHFSRMVAFSEADEDFRPDLDPTPTSFSLDPAYMDQPSTFEVTILLDGTRYQYILHVKAGQVMYEALHAYISSRSQCWFEREYDAALSSDNTPAYHYYFGPNLKGSISGWQSATTGKVPLLTQAARLNAEQLAPIYKWFAQSISVINEHTPKSLFLTKRIMMGTDHRARYQINEFLKLADTGINHIETRLKSSFDHRSSTYSHNRDDIYELTLVHRTKSSETAFTVDQVSSGTRSLLALAGHLVHCITKGGLLVVDELDSSLHPLIVQLIIQLFQSSANDRGAQLIFSTHDATLLDAPWLLRRDQVWLTDKGTDQATTLTSLHEFKPRKGEALERGYLRGRYGGVPFIEGNVLGMPDWLSEQ